MEDPLTQVVESSFREPFQFEASAWHRPAPDVFVSVPDIQGF